MNAPLPLIALLIAAPAATGPILTGAEDTPLSTLVAGPATPPAPSPHEAMARELVDILSRTEAALGACRDAESVQAALPVLREQRERLHRAATAQSELPDPSSEERRAVTEQYADLFTSLAEAIRNHMHRLESAGLATPELITLMQMPHEGTRGKRQ